MLGSLSSVQNVNKQSNILKDEDKQKIIPMIEALAQSVGKKTFQKMLCHTMVQAHTWQQDQRVLLLVTRVLIQLCNNILCIKPTLNINKILSQLSDTMKL